MKHRGEAADRRRDTGAGASVARVARVHGVNAKQVFGRRRQRCRDGHNRTLTRFPSQKEKENCRSSSPKFRTTKHEFLALERHTQSKLPEAPLVVVAPGSG